MQKLARHIKRRYKKLAAALAGAACLSAGLIHGMPVGPHLPMPAAKPLGVQETSLEVQTAQENSPITVANPIESAGTTTEQAVRETATPAEQIAPPTEKTVPEANAKRSIEMTATAYAPGPHDNDQWGSKTHLGTEIRPGVIAVDPRVIPLGSRVMIKYPDGHIEHATAEDTGGAIKGRRIDVAKWTVADANRFGIKAVKVYVLETPSERNEPGA